MHILEPLAKLPLMPDKTIPELVLPHGAVALAQLIESSGRDVLHILHHPRNSQRITGKEQRMPVVRHRNVAANQEAQATPRFFQGAQQHGVLIGRQHRRMALKVDRNEEDSIGEAQPRNVGHAMRVSRRETHREARRSLCLPLVRMGSHDERLSRRGLLDSDILPPALGLPLGGYLCWSEQKPTARHCARRGYHPRA